MARTLTARLGLHRYSDDADTWSWHDWDDDAAQLEALVPRCDTGPSTERPPAGTGERFWFSLDTLVLSYDDGTAWHDIGPTPPPTLPLVQAGQVSVTATSGTGSVHVNFATPYAGPPVVFCQENASAAFRAFPSSVTGTGFNVNLTGSGSGTVAVNWEARPVTQ